MTWIQTIQSMLPLPRPEHRSNQEIEDDLDAEFAFHLEQSTQDVMNEQNVPRETASGVARARFGDVESIKQRCKRIALEERIMLQRVNFMLMLVVILLLISVGVQMFLTQRSSARAFKDIAMQISSIRTASAQSVDGPPSASSERRGGFVYIDGLVARPGTYSIPDVGRLTVARLIAASGGIGSAAEYRVIVTSQAADGTTQERFRTDHFRKDFPADFILAANDHVSVEGLPSTGSSSPGESANPTDRARADALYDFVKTLMNEVGTEHAGDHAFIRQVLDKMEAELPAKYPNNSDLQGLIGEMIAGRRKVLEYDERPVNAGATPGAPSSPD